MAHQVRIKDRFLPTSCGQTVPCADISAKGTKVSDSLSSFSTLSAICSLFLLTVLAAIAGCTNLRYGQMDCAVLQGEAARKCQEYRQRKADADIRAEQAELLQGYNNCRKRHDNKPVETESNCSVYVKPLRSLGSLPE